MLERADANRMHSREMQEFGQVIQKRAKIWKSVNRALNSSHNEDMKASLVNKIDKALNVAK